MDTYARRVAVDLTGRVRWAEGKGPNGYSGEDHLDLLAALLFTPREMFQRELIPIERRSLKRRAGLDPDRRFFAPAELMMNDELLRLANDFRAKKQRGTGLRPTPDEQAANEAQARISAMAFFGAGQGLAIVPVPGTQAYARAGRVR